MNFSVTNRLSNLIKGNSQPLREKNLNLDKKVSFGNSQPLRTHSQPLRDIFQLNNK